MKFNISRFWTAAVLLFVLSSCEEFLDLDPISDATTGNAYNTARDAEAALIGVYDSFHSEYYIWDNVVLNEIITDNFYAGGDNSDIFEFENLTVKPTNPRLWNSWTQIYNAILKANIVLQKVPGVSDANIDKNNRRTQMLGEAAFLRAYHYYNLVRMFGGVPIITEPVKSLDPAETHMPRATEAEVYDRIIADLEFALDNRLPDTYGDDASVNKARATKGAAYALLAKVYAQKTDRDYNKVLEYCNLVINSPAGYALLPDFNHLFDGAHYNNSESIMEVQFVGGTEGNWGPGLLLPPSITGDSWRKFVTPSKDLVKTFDDEGDVIRKNASILFEDAPWADEFWSLNVNGSVPFAYKWKSAGSGASTNRQYIFRLADIILLKAEALNDLGQTGNAAAEVNKIRHRAGLGDTPAASGAEMLLAIEKERRLELVQEVQRWDDLRRYNRAVTVMTDLNEIDLRTNAPKVYNMEEFKQLFPIPQQERNRNLQLGQNFGYN